MGVFHLQKKKNRKTYIGNFRLGRVRSICHKFYSRELRDSEARGPFLEAPETFRARKAIAKSRTLRLQSCFILIFLRWSEVPFIQEISGVCTSPFLDKDDLKMALKARNFFRGFWETGPWSRLKYCERYGTADKVGREIPRNFYWEVSIGKYWEVSTIPFILENDAAVERIKKSCSICVPIFW